MQEDTSCEAIRGGVEDVARDTCSQHPYSAGCILPRRALAQPPAAVFFFSSSSFFLRSGMVSEHRHCATQTALGVEVKGKWLATRRCSVLVLQSASLAAARRRRRRGRVVREEEGQRCFVRRPAT